MKRPVLTSFTIILLIGYSWAENFLDPGPVYRGTGGSVQFNTIFILPPPVFLNISWSFGGLKVIAWSSPGPDDVGPEYVGRVILDKTTGTLTLQSLKLADSGGYTLTLVPADGSQPLYGSTVLEVFDPVTNVSITGPDITLVEGKTSAKFTCDGIGSIITTVWMKDGQRLSASNSIIFSADNRSVSINPVSRSDSGEYICILSNPLSYNQASYSITVLCTSVLTPGEIAGIVVGVILVVLLAVSMFFNFRNCKGFRGNAQIQNEDNIKNHPRQIPKVEENPMKITAFKKTDPYPDPEEIYEEYDEPIYVN